MSSAWTLIHLSSCVIAICPFRNKYLDVLRKEFPGIEFVEGTHGTSPQEAEQFRHLARHMLTAPKPNLPDTGDSGDRTG